MRILTHKDFKNANSDLERVRMLIQIILGQAVYFEGVDVNG